MPSNAVTPAVNIPNPDQLIVERGKVVNYLLNPKHPFGASKARFFADFGFHARDWETLAGELRQHGQTHPVARSHQTPFGPRFVVERNISAPDGRRPCITTVWQLDAGQIAPRLITAYPLEADYD